MKNVTTKIFCLRTAAHPHVLSNQGLNVTLRRTPQNVPSNVLSLTANHALDTTPPLISLSALSVRLAISSMQINAHSVGTGCSMKQSFAMTETM